MNTEITVNGNWLVVSIDIGGIKLYDAIYSSYKFPYLTGLEIYYGNVWTYFSQ